MYNLEGLRSCRRPKEESLRDDFILSAINGYETAQSGNVETRNVMKRFDYDDKRRRNSPAIDTEDVFRGFQISPKNKADFRNFLKGPIDLIKDYNSKLWNNNSYDDWELNN